MRFSFSVRYAIDLSTEECLRFILIGETGLKWYD